MRVMSVVLALTWVGCAASGPRFSQAVATSFARDDMRTLVVDDLEVYYPAAYRKAALLVAGRAQECLEALRARIQPRRPRGRALLFLTSANFNNAYVTGNASGEPLHAVVPLLLTDELFHWLGLSGADLGDVGCHEVLHYVHFEQAEGLWRLVNEVLGPQYSPQWNLDAWFTEGVAQYYEGRLGRQVGRPHSPLYRAAFESYVHGRRGRLDASALSLAQRELYPFTGRYLTGLHFVEYLVERSGEEALWALMYLQGHSPVPPLGATLRFRDVYGKELGELVDEWSQTLARRWTPRPRPANQRVLREEVGQAARLASHPASGTLALLSEGNDEPPTLRVLGPDGAVKAERRLLQLLPGVRDWVFLRPFTVSGLCFSPAGDKLYFVNQDVSSVGETVSTLWRLDVATLQVEKGWPLGLAQGGALSPDGLRYAVVVASPGQAALKVLELESGQLSTWLQLPERQVATGLAFDGTHLYFSLATRRGFGLARSVRGGPLELVAPVEGDEAFDLGARLAADGSLSFARTVEGRLQAVRLSPGGEVEVVTAAPFAVVDPAPVPGGTAFLNRHGSRWTVDVAPVPAVDRPTSTPEPRALTSPTAAADWYAQRPLEGATERPYLGLESIWVPQVRGGSLGFGSPGLLAGLALWGRDRLGYNTWSLGGQVSVPISPGLPGIWIVDASYENQRLAPWSWGLSGVALGGPAWAQASGRAFVATDFFTTRLSLELLGGGTALGQLTAGGAISAQYAAVESTPYGGTQRALTMSARVGPLWVRENGSDRLVWSLRGSVGGSFPVFSPRHSFFAELVGNALVGADRPQVVLGGAPDLFGVPSSFVPGPGVPPLFLVAPRELLRGFEDTSYVASAVAVLNARYRWTIPIDHGWASTLWLFPSLFLQQVELEVFGTLASVDGPLPRLGAVGGEARLRVRFGDALPVTLLYQYAFRGLPGAGLLPPQLHYVGLRF